MDTRRPTIDDVAAAAGVSRQTVSNVLRGTGRVGDATAERIRSVVDRLDYAPHPGASSLRSRRTGQLAYPVNASTLAPDNVVAMEFIRSLVGAAGERGLHVLLSSTGTDGIRELSRSGRVDGFVFSDMFGGDDERLRIVERAGLPYACFGRTPADSRQAWVDVDNTAGVRTATEHIAASGRTDIAYLGFESAGYWDQERLDGYRDAIAALGRAAREHTVRNDPDAMTRATERLLAGTDRPDAVVCSSDRLASEVYRTADHLGLTVGRDVAVSGFDSSIIGRSLTPTLTTMRVRVDRIAERVVERFLRERDGAATGAAADAPGELVVPELVVGASTAPVEDHLR